MRLTPKRAPALLMILFFVLPPSLSANDSAAEMAMGGIILKHEPRISMEKEKLTISLAKVTVEYEFLNETDDPITTQVAFPIPEYAYPGEAIQGKDFSEFKIWVNGRKIAYKIDLHAYVGEREVAALLNQYGIDIASFGKFKHWQTYDKDGAEIYRGYQVQKLSKEKQKELVAYGLVKGFNDELALVPLWTIRKCYYWTQTFPPKKTVRIRHEYQPIVGFEGVWLEAIDNIENQFKDGCIDNELKASLKSAARNSQDLYVYPAWVKYILTTANTWKTPIKTFELIIDPGPAPWFMSGHKEHISFCWDEPVVKRKGLYKVAKTNYIPSSELTVYFF